MSELTLSVSRLRAYLDCGRKYWYSYHSRAPKLTDYPRLCGIVVHRVIQWMHKPSKQPRPHQFRFENKKKAIGFWFHWWNHMLETTTKDGQLQERSPFLDERYRRIGVICICRYWDGNVLRAPPLEIETWYEHKIASGIKLGGRFDQIRTVSLEYIANHRPELIVDGKLHPDYAPVVILDVKTGARDFTISRRRFRTEPSLMAQARRQFELLEDLQATSCSYLYHMVTGKKPIGFVFYHVRSGNAFFTYREERDYATLYGVIHHVLENIGLESFPKNIGRHCEGCDFVIPCREDRDFILVKPESAPDDKSLLELPLVMPSAVGKSMFAQKRLKFGKPKQPRRVPIKPPEEIKKPGRLILLDLPWETSPPKEKIESRKAAP